MLVITADCLYYFVERICRQVLRAGILKFAAAFNKNEFVRKFRP